MKFVGIDRVKANLIYFKQKLLKIVSSYFNIAAYYIEK
jgi:hypothetical protein